MNMHKAITSALARSAPAKPAKGIYDAHYLHVIETFRIAVELDGVSVEIALSKATTSGIGVGQIADLHRVVSERHTRSDTDA
jgi:hypothetical protein